MTWTKLGREFPTDTAIDGLSLAEIAVHAIGLCFSNDRLTDGRITNAEFAWCFGRFPRKSVTAAVDALVAKKYWERTEDGFQILRHMKDQPTRSEVEKEQERWRESKRKSRSSAISPADVPPGLPEGLPQGVPDMSSGSPASPYRTEPNRTDPSRAETLTAKLSDLYAKAAVNEDVTREDFELLYSDYCRREKVMDPAGAAGLEGEQGRAGAGGRADAATARRSGASAVPDMKPGH
ncbi:MAG TPA: hypothetical protein VEJ42_06545 [Streptosporangiaceae bacterium]|nr:hypothetical protein [Streptosporangiaceae bacterium]